MTTTAEDVQPIEFNADQTDLFGLLLKYGALTFVTLGIYRFWAKTHVRRYFWNNITIAGDRLEYLGRPIELLIGFLIAIVILLPLGLIASGTVVVIPLLNAASFLALYWLGLFALYRVRRYRLTRTTWRGIRADQTGSAVRYACLRFGLTVLSLLTLGLAYPWARVTLQRYVLSNTRFGNANVNFNGMVLPLFRDWIPVQVSIVAVVAIFAVNAIDLMAATRVTIEYGVALPPGVRSTVTGIAIFGSVAIIMFIRFRVAEVRYLLQSSSLAGAQASSTLSSLTIFWQAIVSGFVYFGITLVYGFVLGFTAAVSGITAGPEVDPGIVLTQDNQPAAAVALATKIALAVISLIFLSIASIIKTVFFWTPILEKFCATLTTENIQALDQVIQNTNDDPRYGEGLVDALSLDALPI